jgi:hypothetical protein
MEARDSCDEITGVALVDRRLDNLAVKNLVREAGGAQCAVGLSSVKGDSVNTCVLAVVGFKPTRLNTTGAECISAYLYDLRNVRVTGKLIADKSAFTAAVAKPSNGEIEGLLLLIICPIVSIDETTGTLCLMVKQQSQLSIVGRCKYFGRCGAVKRSNTNNLTGENSLCKLPIDSSVTRHCVYHSYTEPVGGGSVGSKRPVNQTGAIEARQPLSQAGAMHSERNEVGEEQDKEDVTFSLRRHGAAVQSILGAAYSIPSNSAASNSRASAHQILGRADEAELRTAQRIIQNLAQQPPGLAGDRRAGVPVLSTIGTGRTAGGDPPMSALSQRALLVEQARSANLRPNPAAAQYAASSYIPPPGPVAAQGASSQPAKKYRMVGDTLIDATNLYRNAPVQPGSGAQVATGGSVAKQAATFHQLLGASAVAPAAGMAPKVKQNGEDARQVNGQSAVNSVGARAGNSTAHPAARASVPPPPPPRPTTSARSTLDAEIDALLGKQSSHAAEADTDWAEGFGKRMDVLAKREYAQTKAAEVHSIGGLISGVPVRFLCCTGAVETVVVRSGINITVCVCTYRYIRLPLRTVREPDYRAVSNSVPGAEAPRAEGFGGKALFRVRSVREARVFSLRQKGPRNEGGAAPGGALLTVWSFSLAPLRAAWFRAAQSVCERCCGRHRCDCGRRGEQAHSERQ